MMETIAEAVERLTAAGYTDQFRAERGQLVALRSGRRFSPERLRADQLVRFEGESDPADEAIVYALSSEDSQVRGTLCIAFGNELPPEEADVLRKLKRCAPG
jgi:hypothetical protein